MYQLFLIDGKNLKESPETSLTFKTLASGRGEGHLKMQLEMKSTNECTSLLNVSSPSRLDLQEIDSSTPRVLESDYKYHTFSSDRCLAREPSSPVISQRCDDVRIWSTLQNFIARIFYTVAKDRACQSLMKSRIRVFSGLLIAAVLLSWHDKGLDWVSQYRYSSKRSVHTKSTASASKSETNVDSQQTPWMWDHNVYYEPLSAHKAMDAYGSLVVERTSASIGEGRNLLIAQMIDRIEDDSVSPISQLGDVDGGFDKHRLLAFIASRPNRAYARQWGRNFVQFQLSTSNTYLGIVSFIMDLLDKQEDFHRIEHPDHQFRPYDALLLLPPRAIITDLDYDLLELIPGDKLLALSGWNAISSDDTSAHTGHHGILLINLQHELIKTVVRRWWEDQQDDGPLLGWFAILESEIDNNEMNISSVLLRLGEAPDGYVLETASFGVETKHQEYTSCIKRFVSHATVSSSTMLPNVDEEIVALESTTDAVCYRFYPKCEVL